MWVDALNGAFQERGANLVNQDIYDSATGDVFRSEYTRGVESAFTFDTVTPHGLLHMECRENVRRKQSIDLLCRQMFARIHGPKP